MSDSTWPFADPRNVAVFTVADIIFRRAPILRACHDDEHGGWQFLTGAPLPGKEDWKLVSLESIARIDATIAELADLPLGWEATRHSVSEQWSRAPQIEEET